MEELRPLPHHDPDGRNRPAVDEMWLVLRHPVEIQPRGLERSAIFSEAGLAADDVVVRDHAGGQRLVHPHPRLLGRLVDVAPADSARRPRTGDVRGHLAGLNSVADATLQRASPDRSVVATAPLVVTLEPLAHLSQLHEIRARPDAAAEIRKEEVRRAFLLCDGVVQLPQEHRPLVEPLPVHHRPRRRQRAALLAVTDRQGSEWRPCVREETIHVVERVDFLHDRGHVVRHVAREHARAKETRVLRVVDGLTLRVALEPLRVRADGFFPIEVRAHASDDAQAAFLRGAAAVAEEVPVAEILSLLVEGHFGLVEGQDSGDADEHDVDLQACPVVGPCFDIERDGIVLGHVQLPDATDLPRPRKGLASAPRLERARPGSVRESGGSGKDEELAAADVHGGQLYSGRARVAPPGSHSGRRATTMKRWGRMSSVERTVKPAAVSSRATV